MDEWLIVIRTDGKNIVGVGIKKLLPFDLTCPDFKFDVLPLSEEVKQILGKIIVEAKEHHLSYP